MKSMRRILGRVLTAFVIVLSANAARADDEWPSHPIKLIAPAAGGANDAVAHIVATGLSQALGQPVLVTNMPGAAGIPGISFTSRSKPDGYTVLISSASIIINPLLQKVPYDWKRDFTPVTQLTSSSHVVVVNPEKTSAKTLPELVKLLKEDPGKYFYGSSGIGSAPHMNTEMVMAVSGTKMTHIPFKSSAETATALLGGDIQVVTDTMQGVLPFVKAGTMRALAVTSATRTPELPDVPSMNEYYPNFPAIDLWLGISVHKGTPQPIVDRLAKEISTYVNSPEGKEKLAVIGSRPVGSTPAEFAARLQTESDTWAKLIKDAGIEVNQ